MRINFSLVASLLALTAGGLRHRDTLPGGHKYPHRGFSEQQIEDNRYPVQFAGNCLTDRKTVETYLLYRAAELTRQNGYDHFRVARARHRSEHQVIAIGGPAIRPSIIGFACDYRYFGPHAAYFYDPYRRNYPAPGLLLPLWLL